MDRLEQELMGLLAAEAPPRQDPAFTAGVMVRIRRKQARQAMLRDSALVVGGTAALAAMAPMIARLTPHVTAMPNFVILAMLMTGAAIVPAWWVTQKG